MWKESNNFINQYYLLDSSICDDLITLFKNFKNKSAGKTDRGVDKTIKDSTDCNLYIKDIENSVVLQSYFKELNEIMGGGLVESEWHQHKNGREINGKNN